MTSFAVILLATLFFYWMRLLPSMAFYVKMIMETIKDLRQFVVFFFLCITTFACATFILDQYQEDLYKNTDHDYNNVMAKQTASPLTDAWINNYLLGLGDFFTKFVGESDFKNV